MRRIASRGYGYLRDVPSLLALATEPRRWERRDWRDKVVFICGCGHTGTTLMLRMLAAHPDVFATMGETGAFMPVRRPPWGALRPLRIGAVRSGKRVLVEKTPGHVRRIDRIRSTLPDARFVIMVRDGRDVTASLFERYSDEDRAFNEWLRGTEFSVAYKDSADTTLVRYEDLVSNPEGTLIAVCQFLDIPFDSGMLEYHRKPVKFDGRDGARPGDGREGEGHAQLRAWQANQPIFDGRGRWKEDLSERILAKFSEGRAAELMAQLGYRVDERA